MKLFFISFLPTTLTSWSASSLSVMYKPISGTRPAFRYHVPISTSSKTFISTSFNENTIEGPPVSSKPDYSNYHGPLGKLIDKMFMFIFRVQFARKLGVDSKLPRTDFGGIVELTNALNSRFSDKEKVQTICVDVIKSIFPPWFCKFFVIFFAKPFPMFSAKLLAFMVRVFGTWLMGECEVISYDVASSASVTFKSEKERKNSSETQNIAKNQGVLIKRCRLLDEVKCASACINSCKKPTQDFFQMYMGINLTMIPNYETGECQFHFGRSPVKEEEEKILNTPCYTLCPSAGKLRT